VPEASRSAEARLLAQRVAALPELAMRRVALARALAGPAPTDAVAVLEALLDAARRTPGHPYTATVAALASTLGDAMLVPYALRQALYEAAKLGGREVVARLFFAAARGPADEPPPPEPERPLSRGGRPLTLGERKSLARGGRRDLLQHLLRDPDAAVIRVLLGNPRLTERDVVFVAARRPVRGDVLRAVFDSRWLAQYHVKRALAMNPYTPGDLAVRLLPSLSPEDLRAVENDHALAEPTRIQAGLLLALGG
jgi:hypothetical protein